MRENFYEELDIFIENLSDKKNDYKILSYVVEELGYIPEEVKRYICKKLDIFPFTLEGTINFYPKLKNSNKKLIKICKGRVCGKKSTEILNYLEKYLNDKDEYVLEIVGCLGRCNKGPNIWIEGDIYSYNTFEDIKKILEDIRRK
ncbi:MAG: NAD(P)H-dependent oxidoreductase subunit E [Cetobacterium sp.]|uniref:NADH-quinone oxidoreductase subunit E n=1 Tax=Cetobacterium ceti TaxID=180163 RepID=A0A1T4Q135_9FUSO|nr:NAD(P)H-dependent oxidoreductase subunit E [Cetobacterium ceti]MCJ8341330.1 NAD(P)H-dependent oxidoreductase subunit E [Cetobacterium sp.]SJZ97492.1 NADH-quinone oxidoreductase subunit E [Cetobacterium ceti]